MKLSNVYMIMLFYLCLLYTLQTGIAASKGKSGPYSTTLLRTSECAKPSRPYEKVPTATYYAEVYNTTKKYNLMRGNATVLRDNKNVMTRFKVYYMDNNKWQLSFFFNNIGCRGMFITVIIKIIGLKYDRKTCTMTKGTYYFNNLDLNQIDHLWAKEREYGRWLGVAESYSKTGVVACWETESVVTPIQ